MTTALEGGEWSAARPGRTLPPGKTRYPLYRRHGGPQGRSGRAENLAPPELIPRSRLLNSFILEGNPPFVMETEFIAAFKRANFQSPF